jgi:pimeloyl-ACP methyl ester carboxylesterase
MKREAIDRLKNSFFWPPPFEGGREGDLNVKIKGHGFPILCLHGHPGSAGCMSVFAERLADRFQVIAPDLRGYGQSRTKQPFQMTDHLLDLEALLKKLNIDRCLLLGWSLGGILALELALRNPEKISGMILIATAARPRSNHPPVSWQDLVYTGLCSIINRIKPGMLWNINTFGKRSLYRYLIQQHTPETYHYLAQEAMSAYLQTSRYANHALNSALKSGYNRLPELSQIQCPCLVLAGADDRHITAVSSRETADRIENCQWQCYPNTAHLFPWEVPGQMLTDIDQWLV